jgi:hypothetical protein
MGLNPGLTKSMPTESIRIFFTEILFMKYFLQLCLPSTPRSPSDFQTRTLTTHFYNDDGDSIDINDIRSCLVNILSSIIILLSLHGALETVLAAACSHSYQIKKAKLNPCLVRRLCWSLRVFFFFWVRPELTLCQLSLCTKYATRFLELLFFFFFHSLVQPISS